MSHCTPVNVRFRVIPSNNGPYSLAVILEPKIKDRSVLPPLTSLAVLGPCGVQVVFTKRDTGHCAHFETGTHAL